jgi:hypothetical protein
MCFELTSDPRDVGTGLIRIRRAREIGQIAQIIGRLKNATER